MSCEKFIYINNKTHIITIIGMVKSTNRRINIKPLVEGYFIEIKYDSEEKSLLYYNINNLYLLLKGS